MTDEFAVAAEQDSAFRLGLDQQHLVERIAVRQRRVEGQCGLLGPQRHEPEAGRIGLERLQDGIG